MSISPDLFDSIVPPEMWVTFGPVEPAYSDFRTITVRVKPFAARSITAKLEVSRYSPEASIFLALREWVTALHSVQTPITKGVMEHTLRQAFTEYVEPF